MRLNETIAELTKRFEEYGEGLYNLTVMGEPSDTEPWGWQLDGHHLIINYFVLRDQVVMTPTFMGSEPVHAEAGQVRRHDGAAGRAEQGPGAHAGADAGSAEESDRCNPEKTANNSLAQAFRDNLVLDYAGMRVSEPQRCADRSSCSTSSTSTSATCSRATRRCRMQEVRSISTTPTSPGSAARVGCRLLLPHPQPGDPDRVRSPDAGGAAGSARAGPASHVHSVVRTPNGNDYGKDLLRQHYAAHQQAAGTRRIRTWLRRRNVRSGS